MDTAQPKVPRKAHIEVKKEARKRGAIESVFYGQVIAAGLKAIRESEK